MLLMITPILLCEYTHHVATEVIAVRSRNNNDKPRFYRYHQKKLVQYRIVCLFLDLSILITYSMQHAHLVRAYMYSCARTI